MLVTFVREYASVLARPWCLSSACHIARTEERIRPASHRVARLGSAHGWLYLALQRAMCLCRLSILSCRTVACSSERKPKRADRGSLAR